MTGSKRGDALAVLIMSQLRKSFPNKVSVFGDYVSEPSLYCYPNALRYMLIDLLPVCEPATSPVVCSLKKQSRNCPRG